MITSAISTSAHGLPRKLLWGGMAALVTGATRFLALLLLARQLGPDQFGKLAWYLWVAELGVVMVTAGWTHSLTRYVSEYRSSGRDGDVAALAAHLIRQAMISAGLGLPLLGGVLVFSSFFDREVAAVAICLYLVGAIGAFAAAWLQGNQTFGRHTVLSLVMGVLVLGASWVGARYSGVAGALAGFLLGGFPALIIVAVVGSRRRGARLARAEQERVWRFTIATWGAAAVSAIVWMRTEIIFLERFAEPWDVGLYASALVFATALTQVVLLFRGVFLPYFAGMAGGGKTKDLRTAYEHSTLWFAVVLFPASLFGAALSPVSARFFGEDFLPAWPLFAVLAIGGMVHVFAAGGALASSLERNRFVFWSACGGAVCFVILCMALIPLWGVWGAAAARLCGQWGMGLAGAIYLTKHAGVRLPIGALLFIAGAAGAGALVCFQLVRPDGWPGGPWIGIVIGGVIYIGLMGVHPLVRAIWRTGRLPPAT